MARVKLVLLAAAVLSLLVAAEGASASSGTITRAYADESWSRGSFAFSATWTDCNTPGCSWLPVATVQPSLPSYACRGDEVFDSDPNTKHIWSGGRHTANGTVAADLTDVPILSGVQGQRLCVSAVETTSIRDPVCVAQAPVLGYDPNTCPFIERISYRRLATALLTIAPPATQPPGTDPADSVSPECRKANKKLKAKKKILRKLKSGDAKPRAVKRARKAVKRAKKAVKAAC